MKAQTEKVLRSIFAVDSEIKGENIERAIAVLHGQPYEDADVARVMPYREVLDRLKVNKYTLRYYVKRGYLTKVLGSGNRAIGVTLESFNRFTTRTTERRKVLV